MESTNSINYYYNRVKNRWRDNNVEEKFVNDYHRISNDSESGNTNIVMQLRKIISLGLDGAIAFDDGSRKVISVREAVIALKKLDDIPKPIYRLELQNRLARSPGDFIRVVT